MNPPALELLGITKTFGTTVANRNVDLCVAKGEIHAVVGENGAGKSTLLQIAAGVQQADSGQIRIAGQPFERPSPARAIARGLGMVQQHFLLIPAFTVAENVVLGEEPRRGIRLDRGAAEQAVRELATRFGLEIDPGRKVEDLSVGEQQRVEILKVLYRKADVLILDEPTAVLAPVEVDELFAVLRSLVSQGRTVVFVTHKLREVMAISDRVTVMRRGEVVTTLPTAETSIPGLAELMVGSSDEVRHALETETSAAPTSPAPLPLSAVPTPSIAPSPYAAPSPSIAPSPYALRIEGLHVKGPHGREVVRGVSIDVKEGEIVGIAGVQGNGQTELIEAVAGLMSYQGTVFLGSESLDGRTPGERLEAGLSHIPEDRQARGLVLDFSIADNVILGAQQNYTRFGSLQQDRISSRADDAVSSFDIRPPVIRATAGSLSGGNQQKIVVARELGRRPRAILAAQPTRGVDIGAMATIHKALRDAAAGGTGILLVSADLSELLALSERILVLYRGEVVGELPRGQATEARLGALMVGGADAAKDGRKDSVR